MSADPLLDKVKHALLCMQRYSWEQGVAAQAFLEDGDTETVVRMAKDAVLRRSSDGRLGIMGAGQLGDLEKSDDEAVNGEPVLYAARKTGDPALLEAARDMLDYLLHRANRTADGTLCQHTTGRLVHSDGIYMSPPYLAVAGEHEEAVRQLEGYRRLLWNKRKRLYSHLWNDESKRFEREDAWGGGNGWAAAGILRVVDALPGSYDAQTRQRLIGYLQDAVDGCLAHVRPDGLFHDVVDNPDTFVETNLSQMLSYVIYRAVSRGWLSASHLEAARKMREAARRKVDRYGLVQDVCSSPAFDRPGTSPEGQAFFILMEAAARNVER